MQKNLFYKSFFTISYILDNKTKAMTLIETFITEFGFINKKFAEIVCEKLDIQPQCLTKPKLI